MQWWQQKKRWTQNILRFLIGKLNVGQKCCRITSQLTSKRRLHIWVRHLNNIPRWHDACAGSNPHIAADTYANHFSRVILYSAFVWHSTGITCSPLWIKGDGKSRRVNREQSPQCHGGSGYTAVFNQRKVGLQNERVGTCRHTSSAAEWL